MNCCVARAAYVFFVLFAFFLQVFGWDYLFVSSYNPASTSLSSSGWTGREWQRRHVPRLSLSESICLQEPTISALLKQLGFMAVNGMWLWLQAVKQAQKKTQMMLLSMGADSATSQGSVSSLLFFLSAKFCAIWNSFNILNRPAKSHRLTF